MRLNARASMLNSEACSRWMERPVSPCPVRSAKRTSCRRGMKMAWAIRSAKTAARVMPARAATSKTTGATQALPSWAWPDQARVMAPSSSSSVQPMQNGTRIRRNNLPLRWPDRVSSTWGLVMGSMLGGGRLGMFLRGVSWWFQVRVWSGKSLATAGGDIPSAREKPHADIHQHHKRQQDKSAGPGHPLV